MLLFIDFGNTHKHKLYEHNSLFEYI